jgi:ATP-dependent DNA helicase PIF1
MRTHRSIEYKWMKQFKTCFLVDPFYGRLRPYYSRQLYYGRNDELYPLNKPENFKKIFKGFAEMHKDSVIDAVLEFLGAIGLTIPKAKLVRHLLERPEDLGIVIAKTNYILKTLANRDDKTDMNSVFRDNLGDLYFLSKIASGESLKEGQLNVFESGPLPSLFKNSPELPPGYEANPDIQMLFEDIENGSSSYYITGKAGTGKSTFIHFLGRQTKKQIVMTAFTGIAAVNIFGRTIHSLFQFPFKPMLPKDHDVLQFPPGSQRRMILENLDILVIDEVSMIRADLLEAIDHSLRLNGNKPDLPFGGKQIILVGDIFQLPPVFDGSDETEKEVFSEIYKTEHFFSSRAYQSLKPKFHEFTTSYRQGKDKVFVTLLDKVRLCEADEACLNDLNKRFDPDYVPSPEDFVITLSTTNAAAERYNQERLQSLPYSPYSFTARITDTFKRQRYPTNEILLLKRDAQVIFTKNDPEQRWVNGTIGKIEVITENYIEVRLQDGNIFKVEKESWENRKYKFDRSKHQIVSYVAGTFEQYPLKLAWAITIHKSQGSTFDKVIIDLGTGAFINGQLYTALSRCRALEGMVLRKKISAADIRMDPRILAFYEEQCRKNNDNSESFLIAAEPEG